MRLFLGLALGMAIIAATMLGQSAYAQGNAIFLATYVDVLPNSVDAAERLLDRYREASRRDEGNLRFQVLEEISRPNRFAIVEAWKDKATPPTTSASTTYCIPAKMPLRIGATPSMS
jgi:hypothetical protein